MRNPRRLHSKLSLVLLAVVLLAVGGALLFHQASAATLCTDLPPSTLRVYDLKAPVLEEVTVPAAELAGLSNAGDLASRHTLMLTVSNVVAWYTIRHRLVPRDDGLVCDAPGLVRMGFGSSRRHAFLARAAAGNSCVREAMLSHEAAHTHALNDVVDRFIDRHGSDFQRGMVALKLTPAPNPETAMARWETGLRIILTEAKRQLLDEIRTASAYIDEPSALTALEDACGGKIRQLEDRRG